MTRLWRSFCSNEGREKRQPLLNATMRKLTRRPAAKAQVLFKIWKGKKNRSTFAPVSFAGEAVTLIFNPPSHWDVKWVLWTSSCTIARLLIHSCRIVHSVKSEKQTISPRVLATWRALATIHPTTSLAPSSPRCFAFQPALPHSLARLKKGRER